MEKMTSTGKCLFCNKEFSKSGMSRHLNTHLAQKATEGAPGRSFHLKIEMDKRYGSSPHFLNLWVDGETDMWNIDSFLRQIWLECCGHLSAFKNPKLKKARMSMWDFMEAERLLEEGKQEEYERMMEDANGEIPMSRKTKDAFSAKQTVKYDYDFGSTTPLQIEVAGAYSVKAPKDIVLLSRNEPLELLCATCSKEPATKICTVCMYKSDAVYCAACAKKHAKSCDDFADYACLPVVNSPRMGVCGYGGGTIDTARDGVFKKKKP